MPEPLDLRHLNHVARRTKNLEASKRFYIEVLGCREISRPGFNFNGSWLYVAGMQFHLIEDMSTPDSPVGINTRDNHLAFAVEDLDAMETRLKDLGVTYRRNLIPDRGIHQLFFRDPDGWLIEVGKYGPIDR
jgi:catechol 2,3-dioxygenase-like lactoylglutathione lyase family enzyme